MKSLFNRLWIAFALGCLVFFCGGGHCLGEILGSGDPAHHLIGGDRIVGEYFHKFDPLNYERLKGRDMEHGVVTLGGGLGELHGVIEIGHGDLDSEIAEMPSLGSFGRSVGSGSGNPASDNNSRYTAGGSNQCDQGGYDECLRACVHLLLWGFSGGALGIAVASILLASRLGLIRFGNPIGHLRRFICKREIITNDTARECAEANAADAPIDGDDTGWIKVSPFGTFPGKKPGRLQIFTEVEANAMVAEFNSVRGRLGRFFRGASVFIGHPDENPDLYQDHRRLGKITALQSRADGLWAEVEWNALGRENQQEGYWVYPSPRWDAPAGRKEFRPDRLLSIGLTNTPRIPTSEPVTNSLDTPTSETEDKDQTTNTDTDMDRKLITEKLGLAVTATDEEILAKLASLMSAEADAAAATQTAVNEATTAKTEKDAIACSLAAETTRANALAADLQATREAHANALLDAAQTAGRITPGDRPAWLPRLTGENREAEANTLASLTPAFNTAALNPDRNRGEVTDEKARRETIANAVSDLMEKKNISYHEAWNQAKRDPALKPVFDAMKTPG